MVLKTHFDHLYMNPAFFIFFYLKAPKQNKTKPLLVLSLILGLHEKNLSQTKHNSTHQENKRQKKKK